METPCKYFHIIKKSLLITYPNLTDADFEAIAENLKSDPTILEEFDAAIDNMKNAPVKQLDDDELADFFARGGVLLGLVQVKDL